MATPPDFSVGQVLTAAQMNAVGLWLVKAQTIGTAVSSVSVSDAFNADFDNYRVVWQMNSASATANVQFQFNSSTGNTYYSNAMYMAPTSAAMTGFGPAATNHVVVGIIGTTNVGGGVIDLYEPNAAQRKPFTCQSMSNAYFWTGGGLDTDTTARTGFNFTLSAGATMTGGTIRVYGYRN